MGEIIGPIIGLMWSTAIIWLVVRRSLRKDESTTGITENDAQQLEELLDIADSMAERIKTLESILDAETPEWRDEHVQQ